MRKLLLKEEFGKEDFNELAALAKKHHNEELKGLVSTLSQMEDKEKELDRLKGKAVNRDLSDKELRHKKELEHEISSKKDKLKRANAIAQELKKEKEEPQKAKEKIEKKVGAEPEVNLRRIRTIQRGHGLRAESYNWKDRVRFYLGEASTKDKEKNNPFKKSLKSKKAKGKKSKDDYEDDGPQSVGDAFGRATGRM